MEIFTSYYQSPLGILSLQCSDEHITALLFTDETRPNIETKEHPLLKACAQQLDEYFAGSRKVFGMPLRQNGTAFQQKVWELLYQIPFGKTISYSDLSKQYGDMKAIRAVAAANGKNNISIIIPCHRVIGSNATLTGYAGGLWRKQWLLQHEAKYHSGVQLLDL